MSRWLTPSLYHASLTQVSSVTTPGSHTDTHTVHTLNTVLFPLRADSSTLGSGAVPSQQSKVCSDGDQTEAAAASRWKRRRRQSSTDTGKENWKRSNSERLESDTD